MVNAIKAVYGWIDNLIQSLAGEGSNLTTSLDEYSEEISDFVDSIIENVTLPVAYTILALFFVMELYKLSLKTESMGASSLGAENVFKVLFKVVICKTVLESTPKILKNIYAATVHIIQGAKGALAEVKLPVKPDALSPIDEILSALERSFWGDLIFLLLLFIGYLIVVIAVAIASVMIIGRFIEIYIYLAVAPIPLATLISDEQSQIGKNFIKSFAAVCIQGFLIYLVLTFFPLLFMSLTTATSLHRASAMGIQFIGFGLILIMALFNTNKWAKSICNAM